MELRNGVIVAIAAITPGVGTAIIEYILTAGSSGWIPFIAGSIGGVPTLVVLLIVQRRQPAAPSAEQSVQTVRAENLVARNVRALISAAFTVRNVRAIASISFAIVGFISGLITINNQSGGHLWDLSSFGISQVTPTASPTSVPPLDRQLEEALTISGTTARNHALFIVAQDAVIKRDYWTAIRAADASPGDASEAQSLSFVARCAIEDGEYDTAAEAATRIGGDVVRNKIQLEVIAARKSAPSEQTPYDGDRENMNCFHVVPEATPTASPTKAPTASPTPVPPLDKQLGEALTISGTTARNHALFIVAQDAVIKRDYWTAIRAADASPGSTSEAQSLALVVRCAIEDGEYNMAAKAAARIRSTTARNQMQLEVIAARKSAPSVQNPYSGDREKMTCLNLSSR